ncbi:hypothetical protein AB4133_20560 [Vibrio sp. 10N.286.52.F8]|uniref:hypothetical protein n=1 Tax=Vibrio sp. 10N.286.52.F8 TaxID=3229716 RepID=UPI003551312C
MRFQTTVALFGLVSIAGCQSTQPSQTVSKANQATSSSNVIVGKSAHDFSDDDIQVPAYFNTQGLQFCSYEAVETDSRCPLARKTIRVHFNDINTQLNRGEQQSSGKVFDELHTSINAFNVDGLVAALENQFAGVNRFRIITADSDAVNQSLERILAEEGASQVAERNSQRAAVSTDYVMSIDVTKSADMMFGAEQSLFHSSMDMSTGFIDPYTRERLSYPNIGRTTTSNFDVRPKGDFASIIVNGNYYRGFNYTSPQDVSGVMAGMATRSFDVMLSRLLTEMPATSQVLGIRGNQISLDRGQNAGILPNETMVIFEYSAGFVEPIGVASVTPSMQSAQGNMVRWKNDNIAKNIQSEAQKGIYQPDRNRQLFAVSVGVPQQFLEERSTWTN